MVLWFYACMVLWFYGFMVFWFYGFMVLRFYGFMVLWLYGFMVLWFYGFLVLWFYGFVVSWFQELTKFPYHVFRKILISYPRLSKKRDGSSSLFGGRLFQNRQKFGSPYMQK